MADYFLKQFYNAVKDPSWPEVNTYNDFVALPTELKQECYSVHNFEQRRTELESKDYWSNTSLGVPAFQHKDVVFVTNYKCASTYYSTFFRNQGWNEVYSNQIDLNNYKTFGLVSNPFVRYFKGIAQSITDVCLTKERTRYNGCDESLLALSENKEFTNFLKNVTITDIHTIPYHVMFKDNLYNIDWIPMESGSADEIKGYIEQALMSCGISINIPRNDQPLNQAFALKKRFYKIVEEAFMQSSDSHKWIVYYYLADSLKFYNQLVDNFNTEGNNWEEISWLRKP
jgi:hypothetical protein